MVKVLAIGAHPRASLFLRVCCYLISVLEDLGFCYRIGFLSCLNETKNSGLCA